MAWWCLGCCSVQDACVSAAAVSCCDGVTTPRHVDQQHNTDSRRQNVDLATAPLTDDAPLHCMTAGVLRSGE